MSKLQGGKKHFTDTTGQSLARRFGSVSPLTLAVGTTALVAATLFVAYDIMRSLDEAQTLAALARPEDAHDMWVGVLQRAALVVVLALTAAAFMFRRYPGLGSLGLLRRVDFEDLIETIPFGVAVWDEAGLLIACNAHYIARLHRDGPTVQRGRAYHDVVKRLIRGGYTKLVTQGTNQRVLELHLEDKTCLMIDERPLASGGFVTLVTDITETKRTDLLLNATREEQRLLARRYHEEKLKAEAASRAKTSFLAHLSHDIRTPLNHIIGFADMIRHQTYGPLGDARYLSYVELIKASGDMMLASFATILELAELEGGTRPLRQDPLSVDELLNGVVRRFSAQAQRAGLAVVEGAPCGARLLGDRFCLERMLGNLVENALRFTPSGGRISLTAYAADDGVVLEISDTGIGMTGEQLERVSQPFVFGDAAFTREHKGAGLGIAIARAIAELSGGHLAIDSSPAFGTTTAVSLPLPPASAIAA
jgi:two-component system cell cycle sensor histidine kinase PleC